jgi:glycosyltransferase 2 family protein
MTSASAWLRASISAAGSRKWIQRAVQLLVSLSLLAWLVSRIDSRTVAAVTSFPFGIFAVSLAIFMSSQIFGSLRLWLLLRRQGINFPFLPLVRLTLVGFFTNNFLPSTVGGDLYKAIALTRRGHDLSTIVVTLIVDRVLSLLTVLLMTLAATAFTDRWRLPSPGTTAYLAEAIAASAVVVLLLAFSSRPIMRLIRSRAPGLSAKLSDRFAKIVALSSRFMASPGTLFLSIVFSILSTLAAVFAQLLIANVLGISVDVIELTSVTGLATLFSLVPISVNGVGVQEVSLVALLQRLGTAEDPAIAFAIFSRALILGTSVFGGLLLLFSGRPAKTPQN